MDMAWKKKISDAGGTLSASKTYQLWEQTVQFDLNLSIQPMKYVRAMCED